MTPLTKPVVRRTNVRDAGRDVVVILGPGNLIGFRLHGTRKIITTTLGGCYMLAAKAEALRIAAERKAKRLARRTR
jgi:hypothetical protein